MSGNKVGIIDIDSKGPNFALAKIAKYHIDKHDQVIWEPLPLFAATMDQVYVSCIFEKNRAKAVKWEGLAEIGGSGYSLTKELPPEIEAVKPKINMGFTTRGCLRHCPWCIVRKKEGKLRVVGDLLDLWDGHSKTITLLDNNILAMPEQFRLICQQAREKNLLIDFNQGLDHRFLNAEIVQELRTIRHKEYRFSFDSLLYLPSVKRALLLLFAGGLKRNFWYVLVGFDSTFAEDYERVMFLRGHGQTVFVMRYRNTAGNMLLARWVNQTPIFKKMRFKQFLQFPRNVAFSEKHRDEIDGYFGTEISF